MVFNVNFYSFFFVYFGGLLLEYLSMVQDIIDVGGMFCVRCRCFYVDDLIIWKIGRCKGTCLYDNFND